MLNTLITYQLSTYKQLVTGQTELPSYKELVTGLKPYYSMVQLKEILQISEGTHNRYLNGSDCSYSLKLQLYLLLEYHKSIPI